MKNSVKSNKTSKHPLLLFCSYLVKWTILATVIGIAIGCCSALFLYTLEAVTLYRTQHLQLVYLLPFAGLGIGLLYFYFGKSVVEGNHLILEEYRTPQAIISLKMVPLIFIGTLVTHLFGGSAGREGTAVQMGSAIADQFSRFFNLKSLDRKLLLALGISGGFAAVFGTPWAGTVFALEILVVGTLRYKTVFPCLVAAFVAHYTCLWWSIKHTIYPTPTLPELSAFPITLVVGCGILFGLLALLFIKATNLWKIGFKKWILYPPLRPFIGGILFLLFYVAVGHPNYLGLGIPTITSSFENTQGMEVFLLKILFTSLTLGSGFKGGEVTPLFFIGATFGSFLSLYIPLPLSFLAALGFVAVFSGATKAPWACTIMGMELFGIEAAIYFLIACWVAAFFAGNPNLYNSPPHPILSKSHSYINSYWKKITISRSSNR